MYVSHLEGFIGSRLIDKVFEVLRYAVLLRKSNDIWQFLDCFLRVFEKKIIEEGLLEKDWMVFWTIMSNF